MEVFLKRSGLTLLEVLMAIFIMGIGMLSVLALFPVAASMMGTAIERYRVSDGIMQAENASDSEVVNFVKLYPSFIYSGATQLYSATSTDPFFMPNATTQAPQYLFLDQAAGMAGKTSLNGTLADKITVAYVNPPATFYPNIPALGLPQVNPPTPPVDMVTPAVINSRFFTISNDVELDDSGAVNIDRTFANPVVSYSGRYTLSYFLEKRDLSTLNPTRRHLLVFSSRDTLFPDFSPDPILAMDVVNYPALIAPKGNNEYRSGQYIMGFNSPNGVYPTQVSFHKIMNVNLNGGQAELEVSPKCGFNFQRIFLLKDVVRVVDLGN